MGICAFLGFRWAVYEPYVIPSGSMIPSLLVYDHILVSKFEFGVRYPFSKSWIYGPSLPKRGDVVVFHSVEENIVMIKRVVGLPGDKVELQSKGKLLINDTEIISERISVEDVETQYQINIPCKDCNNFFLEDLGLGPHLIQLAAEELRFTDGTYNVPEDQLFVLGDNRDRSRDSRYWGFLPIRNLVGRAKWIWLSCEKAVSKAPVLCHPAYIRWQRLFSTIQ